MGMCFELLNKSVSKRNKRFMMMTCRKKYFLKFKQIMVGVIVTGFNIFKFY